MPLGLPQIVGSKRGKDGGFATGGFATGGFVASVFVTPAVLFADSGLIEWCTFWRCFSKRSLRMGQPQTGHFGNCRPRAVNTIWHSQFTGYPSAEITLTAH